MVGVKERGFMVDCFVAIRPFFGVLIFPSQLDVVAVEFAFLALQTKVGRVAVLVQEKKESDCPMRR